MGFEVIERGEATCAFGQRRIVGLTIGTVARQALPCNEHLTHLMQRLGIYIRIRWAGFAQRVAQVVHMLQRRRFVVPQRLLILIYALQLGM